MFFKYFTQIDNDQYIFSFGRFFLNYGFNYQLDSILEREGITLEQILDEENIMTEIKQSGQQKFAKFIMNKPENYVKMINYITQYSSDREDDKKQIKYPFLCSEIFASDNSQLIDFLFDENLSEDQKENSENTQEENKEESKEQVQLDDATIKRQEEISNLNRFTKKKKKIKGSIRQTLLPQLLNFLKQDTICVTSAGYYNKTMVPIIRRRSQSLWKYIHAHKDLIGDLIKHLDTFHIADLVEKLILIEINSQDQETYMKLRHELLSRCFSLMLNKYHYQELIENIAMIFNEIITKVTQNMQNKEWQLFIDTIAQPTKLFEIGDRTQQPQIFQVIINLIRYYGELINQKDADSEQSEQNEKGTDVYKKFYDICNGIPTLLKAPGFVGRNFTTTYGSDIIPLPQVKISVIQLVISLLETNDPSIIDFIADKKTFKVIRDLTVQHQFNNQLIIYFEKLVRLVFGNPQYEQIQRKALDTGFLTFLKDFNQNQQVQVGTLKVPIKPGYQGIFSQISNQLVKNAQSNPLLQEYIQNDQDWKTYVSSILNEINQIQEPFLCGINPKPKPQEEESGSEQDVERILDKFRNTKQRQEDSNQDQKEDINEQVEEQIEKNEDEENENQEQQNYSQIRERSYNNEAVIEGQQEDYVPLFKQAVSIDGPVFKQATSFEINDTNIVHEGPEKVVTLVDEAQQGQSVGIEQLIQITGFFNLIKYIYKEKVTDQQIQKEIIEETIQEVIKSPKAEPQQMADLIQLQELVGLDALQPQDAEKTVEQEVNQYWKNQDHHQQEQEQRHSPHKEHHQEQHSQYQNEKHNKKTEKDDQQLQEEL